jgi:hypothetical protein
LLKESIGLNPLRNCFGDAQNVGSAKKIFPGKPISQRFAGLSYWKEWDRVGARKRQLEKGETSC